MACNLNAQATSAVSFHDNRDKRNIVMNSLTIIATRKSIVVTWLQLRRRTSARTRVHPMHQCIPNKYTTCAQYFCTAVTLRADIILLNTALKCFYQSETVTLTASPKTRDRTTLLYNACCHSHCVLCVLPLGVRKQASVP